MKVVLEVGEIWSIIYLIEQKISELNREIELNKTFIAEGVRVEDFKNIIDYKEKQKQEYLEIISKLKVWEDKK